MRTILVFARASIGSSASYRGAIVVWLIITLIRAGVAIFIWLSAENQILGGYTKPEIISYFTLIMFGDWILMWNPFHPIYQEIKSGQIVTYLVRPVSYLMCMCMALLAFWFTEIRYVNLGDFFRETLDVSKRPVDIFPNALRQFATFVVPVGLVSTIPTKVLLGHIHVANMSLGLGAVITVAVLANLFFQFSLRHYSSASS